MTLGEGLDLQPLDKSAMRRGHMDKASIHVSLIDARFVGKLAMEEVSILTISMFFIVICLYSILCIYFDILLFNVL